MTVCAADCAKCWHLADSSGAAAQRSAPREPFLRESENPFLPLVLLLAWGSKMARVRGPAGTSGSNPEGCQIMQTYYSHSSSAHAHTFRPYTGYVQTHATVVRALLTVY